MRNLFSLPLSCLSLACLVLPAQAQLTIRSNGTISGTVQLPNRNPNFNQGTTRVDTDAQGRYFRNGVLVYSAETFGSGLVGVRSNGTYYVDFRGVPLVSENGSLSSQILQGELQRVQRFNHNTPVKLWGNLQDEVVLQGKFVGIVTDPATGNRYEGSFDFRGQGPRYSDANGGTSPTVFDFRSQYQGTAPKIPAQVTVRSYDIAAMPVRLTVTIPQNTSPLSGNPGSGGSSGNPGNPGSNAPIANGGSGLTNADRSFFEVNHEVLERQERRAGDAAIGPKSRVLVR